MTMLQDITSLKERAAVFVETYTGVDRTDLVAQRRQQELVRARALFTWVVLWHSPTTALKTIGTWLGGRDHSTIHALSRKADWLRDRDPQFSEMCDSWKALCRSRGEVPNGCA